MNYGEFGGQYVSPQLKEKLNFIKKSFNELKKQKEFKEEYKVKRKMYKPYQLTRGHP